MDFSLLNKDFIVILQRNFNDIVMLERKFTSFLESFLLEEPNKILLVNGARQIGKSYLIRYVGQKLFRHFVEINLKEDIEGDKVFADVHTTNDLYMRLSNFYSSPLGDKTDTLVFLDEIQSYPHLMTMLKFLNGESRYRFIASGSQLGVALSETPSVPLGSVTIEQMYPLDFEEFLWATGVGKEWIENIREHFSHEESLDESTHNILLKRFQYYLLVGGLPRPSTIIWLTGIWFASGRHIGTYTISIALTLHNMMRNINLRFARFTTLSPASWKTRRSALYIKI